MVSHIPKYYALLSDELEEVIHVSGDLKGNFMNKRKYHKGY